MYLPSRQGSFRGGSGQRLGAVPVFRNCRTEETCLHIAELLTASGTVVCNNSHEFALDFVIGAGFFWMVLLRVLPKITSVAAMGWWEAGWLGMVSFIGWLDVWASLHWISRPQGGCSGLSYVVTVVFQAGKNESCRIS